MSEMDRRTVLVGTAALSAAVSTVAMAQGNADKPAPVATSSKEYPLLFSPIEIAGVRLKNRVVHAAMSTHYDQYGEQFLNYNVNRARGGAAMIITDPPPVAGGNPIRNPNNDALKRLADGVERYDCRLIGQMQNGGRGRHMVGRNIRSIGVSALPDDFSWQTPHVLSTSDLKQMIDNFVAGALILKKAGYSGVELGAGHGHIIHQLLSTESNSRTDQYGGDLQGRARFLIEMIQGIRAACGRPFLIGVKFPGGDGLPGGIDLPKAKEIAALVHASTNEIDFHTFCWGAQADTLYQHIPDLHGSRMPYMKDILELAKAVPGVPLGALGLITEPREAEAILAAKQADLIMMSRGMVADPAWALKASSGRTFDIRRCVSCNSCFQSTTMLSQTLRCDSNARVGMADEADWQPPKAATPKRVVVVGGGIGGGEAAWVAAARGHDVTLFSASPQLGGSARLQSALPAGQGLIRLYGWQRQAMDKYGVKLKLGQRATLDDIMALKPEAVILAAGSTMLRPDFLTDANGGKSVRDLRQVVREMIVAPRKAKGGTAVIFDKDHTAMTYDAAVYFTDHFDRVVIITPREGIATDEAVTGGQIIRRTVYGKGIEVYDVCAPLASSRFDNGTLVYANVYDRKPKTIEGVSLFTYSTPRRQNDELAAPLRAGGIEPLIIGDCYSPRFGITATGEGSQAGLAV